MNSRTDNQTGLTAERSIQTGVGEPNGSLILASTSPRRKDLLEALGLQFQIIASRVDEVVDSTAPPEAVVVDLARQKAEDVYEMIKPERNDNYLILAADTIVVLDGQYLGKPADFSDACSMLKQLSGRCHEVYTGVWLIRHCTNCAGEGSEDSGFPRSSVERSSSWERSKVFFRELNDAEIVAYVNTGEPMDKAGSYALQGIGAALVEKIDGSHTNIVGLPIPNVVSLLRGAGYGILGVKGSPAAD